MPVYREVSQEFPTPQEALAHCGVSKADAAKHIYSSLGFQKDKDLGEAGIYGNIEDGVYKT